MAKIRLSDPVRMDDGSITTCAALLDSGQAFVEKIEHWAGRGGKIRAAYWVTLYDGRDEAKGVSSGWEIGKLAYESRMGHKISVGS